jgi:hypothetical protein
VIAAYRNVRTIFYFPHSWAVLFSPPTYVFAFAILLNIWTPNALLLLILAYFTDDVGSEPYRHRYRWTILSMAGIYGAAFITSLIIWGSFPIYIDSDGHEVIRGIPFVPWRMSHPFVQ